MGPSRTMKGEARKGQGGTPTLTPSLVLFSLFPSHLLGATAGENLKIREREGKGHHTDLGLLEVVLISTPPTSISPSGLLPTSISPSGFTTLHCWI